MRQILAVAILAGLGAFVDAARIVRSISELDPAVLAKMKAQEPFSAAANNIQKAIAQAGGEASGFAGIEISSTTDAVNVFWKRGATIPKVVNDAISAASTVKVNINSAKYSQEELEAAVESIAPVLRDQGNPFHGASVSHKGDGLEILGDVKTLANGRSANPTEELARALNGTGIASKLNGIPFTLKAQEQSVAMGRFNSNAPWAAGTPLCYYLGGVLARCTAGFAVASEDDGKTYLLTSAHCGTIGVQIGACSGTKYDNANWDANKILGKVTHSKSDNDLALIRVDNLQNAVWDGIPGSEYLKTVRWWEYVVNGEYVCHSGSASGVVCWLMVDSTNMYVCYTSTACVWVASSVLVTGPTAGRAGDSGAPVYRVLTVAGDPNSPFTVAMKGVVSGGGPTRIHFGRFSDAYATWKVSEL